MTEAKTPHILVGTDKIAVVEPEPVAVLAIDAVVECRMYGETLALSLGSVVLDFNGQPEARVVARLRISLGTLIDIERMIADHRAALTAAVQKAKETAN